MRTKKDKEREKYIYWITKKKVINLYIKYGLRITPIISKIDYPVRDILKKWYNNFIINNKKLSFFIQEDLNIEIQKSWKFSFR